MERCETAVHPAYATQPVPGRGGAAFVATQALGWALSSASLVLLALAVARVAAGVAYCIRCWALATGTLMLAAQLVRDCLPNSVL